MATRIGYADLVAFSAALLRAAGLAEGPAEATARLLVRGDLDGYPGHGIRRLVGYLGRAKRGVIQLDEGPRIIREGKTTAVMDGNHYIGQAVGIEAMGLAIAKAAEHGVGIVCVRRAGHVGRLADYVEMEADREGRSCPSGAQGLRAQSDRRGHGRHPVRQRARPRVGRPGSVPVADSDWDALVRSAAELSVADVPAPLETRDARD
ncbi:MAG: Ldh family oxidoreductase [Chloroflexi bacterium]|nr:Ldh family oxidoreductase [Chloroflexota bacterium]